jgi:phospholipase/carboxylesterase
MSEMPIIHENQPIYTIGVGLAKAKVAVITIHGRGAGAHDILSVAGYWPQTDVAYLAPDAAAGREWYPARFFAPLGHNEPNLSSALRLIEKVRQSIAASLPDSQIVIAGFSQGACLALEFAARNPRRYGAIIAYSGGLIGEDADITNHSGNLAQTPVFIGCSDIDPHIPVRRVRASSAVMRELGANVQEIIYPGMGHTINDEELAIGATMIESLLNNQQQA